MTGLKMTSWDADSHNILLSRGKVELVPGVEAGLPVLLAVVGDAQGAGDSQGDKDPGQCPVNLKHPHL